MQGLRCVLLGAHLKCRRPRALSLHSVRQRYWLARRDVCDRSRVARPVACWANALSVKPPSMFPAEAVRFYAGVAKIAARARARTERGQDGHPIWSISEWQAFAKGVRGFAQLQLLGLGMAAYRTVVEVEAMILDGFSAADIHACLAGENAMKTTELNAARNVALPEPSWARIP